MSIPPSAVFDIVADTPGSQVNRRTTAKISYDLDSREFFAQVERFGVEYNIQGNTYEIMNYAMIC